MRPPPKFLSYADAMKQAADLEAGYAAEAAWRLEQSVIAVHRWRLMRRGHSMAHAHAVATAAVATITEGAA